MEFYTRVLWVIVVCAFWTPSCAHGRPHSGSVLKKVLEPCNSKAEPALQDGSNITKVVISSPCDPGGPPPVDTPKKQPTGVTTEQDKTDEEQSLEIERTDAPGATEQSLKPANKKEDLSGGTTGLNSNELLSSEFEVQEEEEEEENVDSLAPRAPSPEIDGGSRAPDTTESTNRPPDHDGPVNNQTPNQRMSELFIESGIFPFIAMGVLSTLFIIMMIAALYFARHSADIQHSQIGTKRMDMGGTPVMSGGTPAFNMVTFRNSKDAVIGDFAVNVFAVRQDEREEARRELTDASESTILATPANTVPKAAAEPTPLDIDDTRTTVLHRDLPDVVSSPSSRRETMSLNRHSTGSSLYMELMNMCRNTRLLEELALRKNKIRMQDASRVDQDCTFLELSGSDTDCKSGRLALRRQASLDSSRCRENVPLPCNYEPHYYKLYDGDDDDSSAPGPSAPASANTTMDTVMLSSDEGCSSTPSSLNRKGSSKRNSRLVDESRLLLPVQEFFNEGLVDSSDGDGGEVLYETIDDSGYRRRTASSRVIRNLMAAREKAGLTGETVVVDNAWESSPKKYDKIDRRIKAYRKQVASDRDYNTLVVKC